MTLRIDDPGPACTVQDLGRPGLARLGVGRSGAADRSALVTANRLVGNADGAAALEVTLGGLRMTALAGCVVGVAGASLPIIVRSGDRSRSEPGPVLQLVAGDQLRLGRPHHGLRSYLAVRGGFDVPEVLGSRSTDTLSGLGPLPLAAGDQLPVGTRTGRGPSPESSPPPVPDDPPRLDLTLGPARRLVHRSGRRDPADLGVVGGPGHRPGGPAAGRSRSRAPDHHGTAE